MAKIATKLTIQINEQGFELSLDDARELRDELNKVLGEPAPLVIDKIVDKLAPYPQPFYPTTPAVPKPFEIWC